MTNPPFPSEAGRLDAIADELHALAARVKGGTLDAAWAEAEAALPEGWRIAALLVEYDGEWAVSLDRLDGDSEADMRPQWRDAGEVHRGPTPAAALRALAVRLREWRPEPTCAACGHVAALHYDPTYRDADSVPWCAGTGPDGLGCPCTLTPAAIRERQL